MNKKLLVFTSIWASSFFLYTSYVILKWPVEWLFWFCVVIFVLKEFIIFGQGRIINKYESLSDKQLDIMHDMKTIILKQKAKLDKENENE